MPVNVGAIPETLIESELFGYVRGAFTGADGRAAGLVEEADHGTLFLDEIGDMPLADAGEAAAHAREQRGAPSRRQRDRAWWTCGSWRPRIAISRREVAEGRFREDLYYRLNVVQIELPPLRERREDIGLLASYFLDRAAQARRARRARVLARGAGSCSSATTTRATCASWRTRSSTRWRSRTGQ